MEINGWEENVFLSTYLWTSREYKLLYYPIDLWVVTCNPVKTYQYIVAQIGNKKMSVIRVALDVDAYRDILGDRTSNVLHSICIVRCS